jgi:hypothetical protein
MRVNTDHSLAQTSRTAVGATGGLGRGRRPCDAWGTGICWTIGAQDAARKVDLFAVKMESRCDEVSTAPAGPDVSIDKMRVISALQSPALPRAPRFTTADVRFALSTAWNNMPRSSLAKPPRRVSPVRSGAFLRHGPACLIGVVRLDGWCCARDENGPYPISTSLLRGFQHLAAGDRWTEARRKRIQPSSPWECRRQ